jgi:hypothetical protein
MHINFETFVIVWIVLASAVIALIAWRQAVTWHCDNSLKLLDAGGISQQATITSKLDLIDKWGKILTAITVLCGLLLGAFYAYHGWVQAYSAN